MKDKINKENRGELNKKDCKKSVPMVICQKNELQTSNKSDFIPHFLLQPSIG